MSPLAFKILLHYYITPVQLDRNKMSDLELDALANFIADAMIEPRKCGDHNWDSHQISDKGKVWVEAMLNTPYPQLRWIVPAREPQGESK